LKILFLSYYYTPDLSAGSFRATRLVRALASQIRSGDVQIDVITTLPNRYHSFSVEANRQESVGTIGIRRLPVTAHKSGILGQVRAYCRFARQVLGCVKGSDYDLVVATSSRLMTAVLGAYVARRKRAVLYLDIRDIFVDTIKHIVPRYSAWGFKLLFSPLEKYAIKRAARVNLISYGFRDYFKSRYPTQSFTNFSNCVDPEFVNRSTASYDSESDASLTVLYAGNIGEGQGLHKVIVDLAERMKNKVRFRIIGDGGRRAVLLEAVQQSGLDSIELVSPISRQELTAEYQRADVLLVHLNDFDAFEKVLPSKLFEYGASGKPIWAGVSGYAAEFIAAEIPNAAVFAPCDVDQAVAAFSRLSMETIRRDDFVEKFACKKILSEMAADILRSTIVESPMSEHDVDQGSAP